MECYGRFSILKEECKKCALAAYCRDAGDLPPLADGSLRAVPLDDGRGHTRECPDDGNIFSAPQSSYTREDMLEMISFLLALDFTTLDYLAKKIETPTLFFSDLARDRKITRQAVHKYVRQKCERIPELAVMLKTRKQLNKQPQRSFMEEVCRIKRRTQMQKSKISKPSWPFLRNWTCSNLSFDLSRMSILKGSSTWKNV